MNDKRQTDDPGRGPLYRVTFVDPDEPADNPVTPAASVTPPATEDPAAPTEPSEPAEPAAVAEPPRAAEDAEPAEAVEPAGAAKAVEPTEPSEPAVVAEPAPAAKTVERTEPAEEEAAEVAPVSGKPAPVRLPLEELRPALEAILLVIDEPVAEVLLTQVLERPREEIVAALESLAAEYTESGRGFALRRAAGGWRLYTREQFAPYVEKFVLDGQTARLTQAALETLAVVAYKQPVTRSRVSAIRGVAVDGVIRTLLTRGMIEECGAEPATGAHLYRTTTLFLEKLGLDSLDELPELAPLLPDLDSLDDVIAAS